MQSVSQDTFGPLVAYLVPGAIVLAGLRPYLPVLDQWFAASGPDAPTIGGFLYLTIAAIAAGMTINAIRWAVLDMIHAMTGLPPPTLDFSRLAGREAAFGLLIAIHYHHYQFFANSFTATAIAYVAYRRSTGFVGTAGWMDLGIVFIEIVFFWTSRDTLQKYFHRSEQLLSPVGRSDTGATEPARVAGMTPGKPRPSAKSSSG
jgi:hypothetical protein